MWTRFTQRAQRVVALAQAEAKSLGERYVSTEHLLLGLIREEDTVAAHVLRTLELEPQVIRAEIARQVTRGAKRPPGDMTLTPRSKRVIDLAYNEARQFGHNYIGTEHLLLGLIRERDGLAGRVLANLGADLEKARDAVEALPTEPVSEKEITASSDSLPRPPSVSTQLLLAQLKDIRQIRGVPAICLSCFGSICLFLGILCLSLGISGGMATVPLLLLSYSFFHCIIPKYEKGIGRKLTECQDKLAVGGLISVLRWQDKRIRAEIMTTLARLLPQLNASDADLLDVDQRACLYTTLTRSHCNRHTEYVLSVIMALEQIGDADALPHIERLTSFRAKTSAEQRVQEAARECLTYLQAHDNRRRESRTLLRAASATETPSDVLLRPASGTAESNPEELLRPSDVEARSQAQD